MFREIKFKYNFSIFYKRTFLILGSLFYDIIKVHENIHSSKVFHFLFIISILNHFNKNVTWMIEFIPIIPTI